MNRRTPRVSRSRVLVAVLAALVLGGLFTPSFATAPPAAPGLARLATARQLGGDQIEAIATFGGSRASPCIAPGCIRMIGPSGMASLSRLSHAHS